MAAIMETAVAVLPEEAATIVIPGYNFPKISFVSIIWETILSLID